MINSFCNPDNPPFKVGDFVKIIDENIVPRYQPIEPFRNEKLHVIEIEWVGFGDEDNPYSGCESGWQMSVNKIDHSTINGGLIKYDSGWFVKWE